MSAQALRRRCSGIHSGLSSRQKGEGLERERPPLLVLIEEIEQVHGWLHLSLTGCSHALPARDGLVDHGESGAIAEQPHQRRLACANVPL
eukprot:scaffold98500_cov28-Tisochrysis_lutea.AAC.1